MHPDADRVCRGSNGGTEAPQTTCGRRSLDENKAGKLTFQSFETANLRYLRAKPGRRGHVHMMQLVDLGADRPADVAAAGTGPSYAEMVTPSALAEVARYADVIAR